ncbi:site-specific DNA-methyltransferase [Neisseria perflava]|uniref:site-specific DNA-methyltransferase n=1 Tax=Neisseria perflava TaxID=33053 RepID=UPI00209DA1F2|nr:site-specific DNA-methyltransferase [Neisseria perflava]MCP1659480.1 adenine-specific DNA-methyltransferase [Neisseria perflava]
MATEPNRTEPNRTEIIHENLNNINENNLLKFKNLFPEAFCEGKIDREKLKLILGADNLADANERYMLGWAGKADAYRTLQSPTFNTLIPCQAESVDFEHTQNVFIEAENLEALKILQKSYAGAVKMIYIDPPYNTGSDSFIYPDKFSETREEYARRVGDKDDDGYLKRDGVFQGAFRKNSRDNGNYHSNWLSMMLPRLHLAKTLLREDGVIFISIDDNEQAQLKLLCDEVFGAENFVGQFPWRKRTAKSDVPFGVSSDYEFILAYAKTEDFIASIEGKERKYFETDDFPNRPWRIHDLTTQRNASERPNSFFTLKNPKTGKEYPANPLRTWAVTQDTFQDYYDAGKIVFPDDYDFLNISNPVMRYFKDDDIAKAGESFGRIAVSTKLPESVGMSLNGTKEITELFQGKLFDFPKPTSLIQFFLNVLHDENALILDFFSGSGTTAHAVMQLNAEDGGKRRYLCVQLPEETDEKSEAFKAGYPTIAEIAKERIRRAGRQISDGLAAGQSVDTGFKVFKLAESGFKQWRNPSAGRLNAEEQLALFAEFRDVVRDGVSTEQLAYELMLRLGFQLTDSITFSDGIVWLDNAAATRKTALLLEKADEETLAAVAAGKPVKVFALDKVFAGDDALKTNAALQFKDAGVAFETL